MLQSSKKSFLIFLILLFSVSVFSFILTPQAVEAASYQCMCEGTPGKIYESYNKCDAKCDQECFKKTGECKKITSNGNDNKLQNPLGDRTIPEIIGDAIRIALGVIGSIALVLFIYGGFVWMTAGGNPQRVTTGRNILIWATIGLLVIFTSYAILRFIFGALK